jgi:AhpD family alkylhydroperoxidase
LFLFYAKNRVFSRKLITIMSDLVKEFNDYRARMNDRIMNEDNLVIKRFFNLDTNTYAEGALDVKTKEMLGLVASMVLRCDDCIKYHIEKCHENGVNKEELFEVFQVGLIVGGSIVIPHLRRAVEYYDQLK